MQQRVLRIAQYLLLVVSAVLIVGLAILAQPQYLKHHPHFLGSFGKPAHWPSIAIVAGVVFALCVVSYLVRRNRTSATVPLVIVVGLLTSAALLGFATYTQCVNDYTAPFFTALEWTSALVKGGTENRTLIEAEKSCPVPLPASLSVARLMVLASFAVGVIGVATAAFRMQSDRMRVWWARSITAVVGVDDEAVSMITAIARRSKSGRRGALVLMTMKPDGSAQQQCRAMGARVLQVDFDHPETMGSSRFWRNVDRLYLLSPDPSTNLARVRTISKLLTTANARRRLPSIVRIDDPWLAMAWRAEQLGGSDTRWIGDAVSKFEVTARKLLDQIMLATSIEKILVCGSSPLTLALCADMTRRQLERDYHALQHESPLPKLVLIAEDSRKYQQDHRFQQDERGFGTSEVVVDVVEHEVTEAVLREQVPRAAEPHCAAIFVDSITDATAATRLAVRFRNMQVYAWDPDASVAAESVPIAGKLRNYRLGIDLPKGQAEDNFERAAMLTHERFTADARKDETRYRPRNSELDPNLPWDELSPFYKDSNRHQVRHMLQIVEQLGGHTWNTWGEPQDDETVETLNSCETPTQKLAMLGFDDTDAVMAMARAEFERWRSYLIDHGWQYGPKVDGHRDYDAKRHEKLVTWEETTQNPALLHSALDSVATSLVQLRELGYRSKEKWKPHRRKGEVTARRKPWDWTWLTDAKAELVARRGDWSVRDASGDAWSVRQDVFPSSYEHVGGHRWKARGVVLARRAEAGELIETLEGPETALDGDWVVMGDGGEQWTASDEKFRRRFEVEPVSFTERFEHWNALRQGSLRLSWFRRLSSYL